MWTREAKGEKVEEGIEWSNAKPSKTHMALVELEKRGLIQWLVSQNVDGLHARSGFPLNRFAELHGNVFAIHCQSCKYRKIQDHPVELIGQKPIGKICGQTNSRGSVCRRQLVDSVLDWEHDLPEPFFSDSWAQSEAADLSIVLGSSLQIQPANTLPTLSKNMVIINLSNTKMDRKANLIIKSKCDFAVELLMKKLDIEIPEFSTPLIVEKSCLELKPLPIKEEKPKIARRKRKAKPKSDEDPDYTYHSVPKLLKDEITDKNL